MKPLVCYSPLTQNERAQTSKQELGGAGEGKMVCVVAKFASCQIGTSLLLPLFLCSGFKAPHHRSCPAFSTELMHIVNAEQNDDD